MSGETPEQRRERLQALRTAAAASTTGFSNMASPLSSVSPAASTGTLPCPSPFSSPSMVSDDPSPREMRFDYYTNPAAAFSSTRKRDSPSTPPNFGKHRNGPPAHLFHQTHLSGFTSTVYSESPSSIPPAEWRSPYQPQPPVGGYPMTPFFHDQHQSPSSGYLGTPPGVFPPGRGVPRSPNYPNATRFGQMNPGSGQGGVYVQHFGPRSGPSSEHGRDRGQHYRGFSGGRGSSGGRGKGLDYDSPSPASEHGRGRGQHYCGFSGGRGSGGGRGRGLGYDSPGPYNCRSALQDPWEGLEPIVGSILVPRDGSKSAKEDEPERDAKKSKQELNTTRTSSGLSLAQYLDQCINEAPSE